MHVVERVDGAIGRRTRSADRRGWLQTTTPAALQLVARRIVFAPLAACEKCPFERILQSFVVRAVPAPSVLGAAPHDLQSIEDPVMPIAIVGPLANHRVQAWPIAGRNRLAPVVEIGQNAPQHTKATRIANARQKRQRFCDPRVGFLSVRPMRELRQSRTTGTTCSVQVADHHVVQQQIV